MNHTCQLLGHNFDGLIRTEYGYTGFVLSKKSLWFVEYELCSRCGFVNKLCGYSSDKEKL